MIRSPSGKTNKASKAATLPTQDRAHDVLRSEPHPLDAIFAPQSVAVIGATETGQRRPHRPLEPDQQPVRRDGLPGQPEAPQRAGDQGVPEHRGSARPGRPGRRGHARADRARRDRRVREAGVRGAIIISAGFKELGERARSSSARSSSAFRAGLRLIGPNCLGVMSPLSGLNATFAADRPPGQRRLPQPERRALHGDPRLEPARARRLQRVRLDRLDARRRLGRPDRLPRRRPAHPEHRHLHGVDRRRAVVPLGGARGGADQADHRDQGRPHRGRGQGRGVAHRLADRQRRGARRRLPPLRRAARQTRSPTSSTWPRCSPSSRARRARGWRSSPTPAGPACSPPTRLIARRRRARRALAETIDGARTRSCPPHWSHDNPIDILGDADPDRYAKALEIAAQDPEQRRPAGDPDAAGA